MVSTHCISRTGLFACNTNGLRSNYRPQICRVAAPNRFVSRQRTGRNLQIKCLKHYSGHARVSTPQVNENGIVVWHWSQVIGGSLAVPAVESILQRMTCRSKAQMRHPSRRSFVPTEARSQFESFELAQSSGSERCVSRLPAIYMLAQDMHHLNAQNKVLQQPVESAYNEKHSIAVCHWSTELQSRSYCICHTCETAL